MNSVTLANGQVLQLAVGNTYEFLMTPEIATHIDETFPRHNRPLNSVRLNQYVACMANGTWRPEFREGRHMKIDTEGKIVSAQHRIKAIIKTGVTIPVMLEVVDRSLNTELTTEKYTSKERAAMHLPDRGLSTKAVSAIDDVAGQLPYLSMSKPHVSYSSATRDMETAEEVYDKIGEQVQELSKIKGVPQRPLSAVSVLLMAKYITFEEAIDFLSDKAVLSVKLTSLLQWVSYFKQLKDGVVPELVKFPKKLYL